MAGTHTSTDLADHIAALQHKGISSLRRAFSVEWVDRMHHDVLDAFAQARTRDGGAISRGPERWYVEVNPEQLRGFGDIITHPWITDVCEAVLGPDYEIVEIGFDIPLPGAVNQPWHRDFPSPEETYRHRRLTSLAFNLTTVDTTPEMGPFEIAPGTQYETGVNWPHQMFPPRSQWHRYEEISERRMPNRGDVAVRSALTLHRGTANRSGSPRPVVVLGVDAPGAGHAELHDMSVTPAFWDRLEPESRRHLRARVVEQPEPVVQKHDIEGLMMGVSDDDGAAK